MRLQRLFDASAPFFRSIMKDSFYFPHDTNAREDPKISALIAEYGLAGYGLYWCLIEIMHAQGGKIEKFPKLYEGLAYQLRIPNEAVLQQIEAMLHVLHLLQEDEKFIWSNRVLKNIEDRNLKRLAKSEAGRRGGLKSGETRSRENPNEAEVKQNEAVLQAHRTKRSKGKERKLNIKKEIYKEKNDEFLEYGKFKNVLLSLSELEKLKDEFPNDWEDRITRLDEGIELKGYEYKSHYAAIHNWAKREPGQPGAKITWWFNEKKFVGTKEELEKIAAKTSAIAVVALRQHLSTLS